MENTSKMRASENLKDFIKRYEDLKLESYQDKADVWTIGYGHTQKGVIVEGMKISQRQADDFLNNDLKKFENTVNKYVKVPLSQNQFDALVSFSYNVGPTNFQTSTLLKLLNNGDYEGASEQFEVWNKITNPKTNKKETSDGLSVRRYDEEKIFINGNYDRTDIKFYRQNIKHSQVQTSQITTEIVPEKSHKSFTSTSQDTVIQTQNPIKHTWEGFEGLQLITDKYEYAVATSLLKNELGGVSNGYELSHAETGKSGWSFGGHQMDLSVNKEGVNLLKDIVINSYGSNYWTPQLEASLKMTNNPNSISSDIKKEINIALSSDYGKTKINENFKEFISKLTNHIDQVEKQLQNINSNLQLSAGEKFMLADYHNQYNLSLNSQSSASMIKKLENCVTENKNITLDDIKSFVEDTKYYKENSDIQTKRVDSTYTLAKEFDKELLNEKQSKNTENILEKSNESFISTNHIYKIQKGDTLSKIAQNNNITVDKLVENNPWLIEENRVNQNGNYALIKVGEKLNLTNNNSEREPSAVKELWEYISKNGINLNDIKSFLEEVKKEHHIKDEVSSEESNQSFNNYRQ